MTFDEKKEFLQGYLESEHDIRSLERERQKWRDISEKITQNISPAQGGGGVSDRVGQAVAEIADIDAEILRESELAKEQRKKVVNAIKKVKNRRYRTVLKMIYLSGMNQYEVAEALGKCVRNIQDLHKKAVNSLDV